jgi:hypothetical protein
MLKSTHNAVAAENYLLRDALKEANAELRKHRILIAGLRNAHSDTIDKVMKAFQK